MTLRPILVLAAVGLFSLAVPAGAWRFSPPTDPFSPSAALDLRSLNEPVAGQDGFVHRSPDGADFVLGNGKAVRFWAVDEYIQNTDNLRTVQYKARWLAKRGVNMVRVHSVLVPDTAGSKVTDVKQDEIDRIWMLVAAMKAQGIYTTISPYWAVPVKIQDSWGIPGGSGQSACALLFWDKTLQQGYRAWLRALYEPKNKYTGIPLSQDPAVAIIQIQNEDSDLFWTMQNVTGPQLDTVRANFAAFLVKKYGSLDAANTAWGGEHPADSDFQAKQGDDFANAKVGIYITWNLTVSQSGYKQKRLADQLEFLVDTMRDFNTATIDYLRNDLHCKQLINCGNWRPADPGLLFDAERYGQMVGDVIGVNRYVNGEHTGQNAGWAVQPGDRFTNVSVLRDPLIMETNVRQPVGYPFILPETQWVTPSEYQSEGPFLTAAYESLTGVDIAYFFADGDMPDWQQPFTRPGQGWPPMAEWQIATPMQLGQFPAAALMYRRYYIRTGKPAVHEERSIDDVWQRKPVLIDEEGGYDPNRDMGDLPEHSAVKTAIDPFAFLVGPVEVKIGGDPAKSTALDMSGLIDRDSKTIKSDTGQIVLHYGDNGVATLDTFNAQGATGFLGAAGQVNLDDVVIDCKNDYATVTVVSLDGLPIHDSAKVLIQVGTVARPTDWKEKDATWTSEDGKQSFVGKEVVSPGEDPWDIVPTQATVTVRSGRLKTATALDANLTPTAPVTSTRDMGHLVVTMPPDTLYVLLQ